MKNFITIVSGDPNSIGFEILAKAWKKLDLNKKKGIILIGSFDLLYHQLKKLNINIPLLKIKNFDEIFLSSKILVIDVPIKFKNPFKVEERNIKKYVLSCVKIAHDLSIKNKIRGFINLPINKRIVFPNKNIGMTEYLSKKNHVFRSEAMIIYNKDFCVVPITTHIDVKNISKSLNKSLIEKKIITTNNFLKKINKKKPVIAVLGLNPHSGEMRKNTEENRIIIPALKNLKNKKINVIGPFSADTIFVNKKKYNYNVIVGMYHDQVLAPFKSIFNFKAINITLGLKYLRISPDHGTGKDIIGQKKADPTSLIEAINFFKRFVKC